MSDPRTTHTDDATLGTPRSTGSAPTDTHQAVNGLLTRTLLEIARRRQDELPGLVESLQDQVLVTTGGTTRSGVYGWFCPGAWRLQGQQVHELFVNASRRAFDPSLEPAECTLVTLCHELSHVWAHANDIHDTSREGRYHNHRFGKIAVQIGLDIERNPTIGLLTPRLSEEGRSDYSDLLAQLRRDMVLVREPMRTATWPGGDGQEGEEEPIGEAARADARYVFASCRCQAGRGPVTIRVAAGSWRVGVIRCGECDTAFTATDRS